MTAGQIGELGGKVVVVLISIGILQLSVRRLRKPGGGRVLPVVGIIFGALLLLSSARLLVASIS